MNFRQIIETPTANKNYISIGVSVRTTNSVARNSGGVARQESNPQSPTAYSSVRCPQAQEDSATVKNLLQKEKKEKCYNEQPTHKTAHSQAPTHKLMLQLAKEQFSCRRTAGN